MRAEVQRIQRRINVATIYVTHDQVEAMTMGDRVIVMRDGMLQQVDTRRLSTITRTTSSWPPSSARRP
jgi:ABC-type sugar transport system ATPase subunit